MTAISMQASLRLPTTPRIRSKELRDFLDAIPADATLKADVKIQRADRQGETDTTTVDLVATWITGPNHELHPDEH